MRPFPRVSTCVAAITLGLLLAFCNSGKPEEPRKAQPTLKELQQKRLALLVHISEGAKRIFERSQVEYAVAHAAELELFAASLDYADTDADRIKACDLAIEDSRRLQSIIKEQIKAGHGSEMDLFRAQEFELQAQIARTKAEAGN